MKLKWVFCASSVGKPDGLESTSGIVLKIVLELIVLLLHLQFTVNEYLSLLSLLSLTVSDFRGVLCVDAIHSKRIRMWCAACSFKIVLPEVMKLSWWRGREFRSGSFPGSESWQTVANSFLSLNKILLSWGNKRSSLVAVEWVSRFDGLVSFFSCVLLLLCHPPPHTTTALMAESVPGTTKSLCDWFTSVLYLSTLVCSSPEGLQTSSSETQ